MQTIEFLEAIKRANEYCFKHGCEGCPYKSNSDSECVLVDDYLSNIDVISVVDDTEKTILRALDNQYHWIARNYDGSVLLFENKPVKKGKYWTGEGGCEKLPYPNRFKVLGLDDEPTEISTLINYKDV